ncbi:MAG: hypothetical protein JXQ93_09375 [Flavobacteriaceae bacterium]
MKKLLFVFLSLTLLSCETSVKKEERKTTVIKEAPKEIVVEKKVEKIDNTLVRLQRNPCSGDCPVFEVTITKDSTLTYKGIQYTNIKGAHTLKLSEEQYYKLSKILDKSKFAKLKDRYATSGTKDFPETVIRYQGKKVTVRLWKDAPDRLTDIYVFIEDILYSNKYLK